MSEKQVLNCSFCGKSQDEVKQLIAGPAVYICNECIFLCIDIALKEDPLILRSPERIIVALTPDEEKNFLPTDFFSKLCEAAAERRRQKESKLDALNREEEVLKKRLEEVVNEKKSLATIEE